MQIYRLMAANKTKPKGRTTSYTKAMGEFICEQLAMTERSLRSICAELGIHHTKVLYWAEFPDEESRPGFAEMYKRARQIQAEAMFDEIRSIADDSSKDKTKKNIGGKMVEVVDHEHIMRDKLRVDSRKWILSKMKPERFGDAIKVDHTGTIDLVARLSAARNRVDLLTQPAARIAAKTIEAVTDVIITQRAEMAEDEEDV